MTNDDRNQQSLDEQVARLQKEAFSKDIFRKIDTIIEFLVPDEDYMEGRHVSNIYRKDGLEIRRNGCGDRCIGLWGRFYDCIILHNRRLVFQGALLFDICMSPREHEKEEDTKETLKKINELCGRYSGPECVDAYHPGDWEQKLDKIYREAIDMRKTERDREREEQRVRELRKNFGIS